MASEVFVFDDELFGTGVTVIVETTGGHDESILEKDGMGLHLCLYAEAPGVPSSAHIPREQAQEIIKTMKAVLDEE